MSFSARFGLERLSVAAVARIVGISRTAAYYYFPDRDALVRAIREWSSERVAEGFGGDDPISNIERISQFSLQHPDAAKLFMEDLTSTSRIRDLVPGWDSVVEAVKAPPHAKDDTEAEVLAVIMLVASIIGPQIYRLGVRPNETAESIARQFGDVCRRLAIPDLVD